MGEWVEEWAAVLAVSYSHLGLWTQLNTESMKNVAY